MQCCQIKQKIIVNAPFFSFSSKSLHIKGVSKCGMPLVMTSMTDKSKVEISNPLETLLGSLIGCTNVSFRTICKEQGIEVDRLVFSEVTSQYELAGFFDESAPKNQLDLITIKAQVQANLSPEQLQKIVASVATRCPVHNMLCKAGVQIDCQWTVL